MLPLFAQELAGVTEGAIAIQPLVKNMPGFDEYFASLTPENNARNPWFPEYWQLRDPHETSRSHYSPG